MPVVGEKQFFEFKLIMEKIRRTSKAIVFFRMVALATGLVLIVLGVVWPTLDKPVLVLGLPDDLGSIDGNAPRNIAIRLLNPVPTRTLKVRDIGCGCSIKAPKDGMYTLAGLSSKEMVLSLDPDRLPVGPGSQAIVISGYSNGEPFQFTRRFHYVVVRGRK